MSYEATEEDIRALLSEIDPGVRVRLGIDRATGKARGVAFAQFGSDTLAADAVRRFDGADLRGRRMRVNDADDKPPARGPVPSRPDGARPGGGGGPSFAPRAPIEMAPPPEEGGGGDFRGFRKGGGSRRGLRARKRSLRY